MAKRKDSVLDDELVKKVEGYESYIRHNGVTMEVINAYTMATKTAYAISDTKQKTDYARMVSSRAKEIIEHYCEKHAHGTIWELEAFAQRNNKTYDIIESYYEILLQEARAMNFDSYCLCLEKNRPYRQRFYYPRRKCFIKHGFIQGFQDILDDKLDILMISMPPSVGKSLSMTSKVLTPTGFKLMHDIHVGDEVIGGSGQVATVFGVYPQGVLPVCRITLDDGSSCEASYDHLWKVKYKFNKSADFFAIIETRQVQANREQFQIPKFEDGKEVYHDIKSIEYLRDCECQCIYISDPTHLFVTDDYILTHNTTLEKFFHSAICGWFPREANLFYSHSAGITKMYYEGMVDILTNDIDYCWGKIFPDCTITSTNAALEQININAYKPFPNVQTATVGSKMAGKVRCSKLLLVDDVIGGIEEAVNKVQLDKIWNKYTTDARQRRKEDENKIPCKEIHIATRWSVHDVIGRLQRAYKGNDRVRTIAVPDIDPVTGESNFLFEFGGFTVQFYEDIRHTMDEVSYRCLYKNDPIEREGILYEADTLQRYHSLPIDPPQAVKATCDTKTKGIDYTAAPFLLQYDDMYYLVDAICDDGTNFDIQEDKLVQKIISNNVTKIRFESNQGGSRLAENVKSKLNKARYNTEILSVYTSKNKATRIIVHSDWVKRHVIFPAPELIVPKSELAKFMEFLTTYTVMGDNKYDDVPDSMAQFGEMENKQNTKNYAEAGINPFWDY